MKIGTYESHPAADIFPMLEGPDLYGLADDIEKNGLREPIWTTTDGLVLDGRNRLRACEIAKVEPAFRTYEGTDPVGFALSLNLHRRHLTESQKSMIGVDAKPLYEEMARRRQGTRTDIQETFPESAKGQARDRAAAAVGVSGRSISFAEKVKIGGTAELADAVRSGDVPVSVAAKIADRGEDEQRSFVDRVKRQKDAKGFVSGAAVLRQHEKAKATDRIVNATPTLPEGPFSVIVADPPWAYEVGNDDGTKRGVMAYPSMTTEAICAMDVSALAADDCVLWLWTTNAFMRDAYRVLDAWGFQEKTILTWEKTQIGLGDWLRNVTEHCILAVRGRPTVNGSSQPTHFRAQRREHSRKPDEFFEIVEDTCPAPVGGYLELFCREPRIGWTGWGAEAGKFRASDRVAKVEKLDAPKSAEPDAYADHFRLVRSRMAKSFKASHMQNHGSLDLIKRAETLLRMSAAIECPTCEGKSTECRSCAGRGWVTRGDARALGKGAA